MRQLFQNLQSGAVTVENVPLPQPGAGQILVRTTRTLVSIGTERMLLEFGQAGWLGKVRQQPEKVRQVVDKIRTDGLLTTVERVRSKLSSPLALGYCHVGVVEAVGRGVTEFQVGDRVVTNGPHAEMVVAPVNLCAAIPDGVDDDSAAFTVPASIGLQGIRLVAPSLGETVVVLGLGLIGLITVQLLRANGCRAVGFDFDAGKVEMARRFGAEAFVLGALDPVSTVNGLTGGVGADAVIITASTRSDDPIHQAPQMCRQRGRVVLVGVVGLNLSRADFYAKEISFQVSCSYGPGRYDPNYEEKGVDFPIGFVRWTEQRNFQAVLELLRAKRLDFAPLVTLRTAITDAPALYADLGTRTNLLGIVIDYPGPVDMARTVQVAPAAAGQQRAVVGMIGAGLFVGATLGPVLKAAGARLKTVISGRGASARHAAEKYGFETAGSDLDALFADPEIDTLVIATRHSSHAALVERALRAGKACFVEKPLATDTAGIERIWQACEELGAARPLLTVGFNRRFAPLTEALAARIDPNATPVAMVMTVNAGALPATHWTQDPEEGGRLIGEGCHFVDLLRFLARAPIESAEVAYMDAATRDTFSISLRFANGSIGTVHYFANGAPSFPKERLEVFSAGKVLAIENFRGSNFSKGLLPKAQDKGHAKEIATLIAAIRGGGPEPIPADQLFEVARVTVALAAGSAYRA